MISQRSSSVLRGIFALLLATMQPPLRVSQILAELSEGAPLANMDMDWLARFIGPKEDPIAANKKKARQL